MTTVSTAIELSIIVPAFDEAAKIDADVRAAQSFLDHTLAGRGEILVVDDGSTDGTGAHALRLERDFPALQVIHYTPNRGKGYALRRGVAASRGRLVMFADAGSCVPYDDAARGMELLRAGTDLAHGSRRCAASKVIAKQPLHRRAGSRVFRWVLRAALGLPRELRDTQCGFKIYRGDVARELFAECHTDGFMLDIELIRRARNKGLKISEFGVRWSNDRDTHYRPIAGTWRNLVELLRIRATT